MIAPLVSVIVPAYNRAAWLREAVESVFAQTLADWELIVVDDGSTDGTRGYLHALPSDARIHLVALAHSGNPARVRNAGLRTARGRFVAFLDSDDRWTPDKLERQVSLMLAEPLRRWSYTGFRHIDASGVALQEERTARWSPCDGSIFAAAVTGAAPIRTASVVMVARMLVSDAGGFDEQLVSGQDYDLWTRLALCHPVSVLDAPLADVRVHPTSHSSRYPPRALRCRDLSLRKLAKAAPHAWQRLIARERRRNAGRLAASLLEHGERAAMFTVMRESLRFCWRDARWWAASVRSLLRAVLPGAGAMPGRAHVR